MGRIFISYAREDREAASQLYLDLKRSGLDPWLDSVDLLPGQDWENAIAEAIESSSHFIALLSSRSVGKRGYVQRELRKALEVLEEFPEDQIFVVPVRLDDCLPTHRRLRRLHWIDLYPAYEEALKKILEALGVSGHDVALSRADYERATSLLVEEFVMLGRDSDHPYSRRRYAELSEALEAMAVDADAQFVIGKKIGLQALAYAEANDGKPYVAIEMLHRSGKEEAIPVLARFLNYTIGPSVDHIECCERPVVEKAMEALAEMTAENSEWRFKVAVEGRKSTWFNYLLKKWVMGLLRGVENDSPYFKEASEQLHELAG